MIAYCGSTLDHQTTNQSGEPAMEFSWERSDGADGTQLIGRRWAVLKNNELHGEFFIHDADDPEFIAKPGGRPKSAKSK